MNDWYACLIETTKEGLPFLEGYLLGRGVGGLVIHDPDEFAAFLAGEGEHWDYLDDSLYEKKDAPASVTFYLPKNGQGKDSYQEIVAGLSELRASLPEVDFGVLSVTGETVREEDWANEWKQYYHKTKIGSRLLICPSWELTETGTPPYTEDGRAVLVLDPGMAFGTGGHASTRLCLTLLEQVAKAGDALLDLGCGSGILSVAGLLLGAKSAVGVDIDQKAVEVSRENAARSGVEKRYRALCGDLTEQVSGKYDLICANIVADVILRLIPDMGAYLAFGGKIILSGIITKRKPEILNALCGAGYRLLEEKEEDGWCALLVTK